MSDSDWTTKSLDELNVRDGKTITFADLAEIMLQALGGF